MATTIAGVTVVGVVGAGTMGAGIAQVALEAGHEVVLHDVDEAAIERGRARIADGLTRRAAKGGLRGADADGWASERLGRLRGAHVLDAVGAEADLVIEAAHEDLALKQTLFRALDAASPPETILATNTSALPVSEIAAATERPARVIGLHFFNPAPLMALVEVVAPDLADVSVVERAERVVAAWGKTPVRSRDLPGFIVNRVNRPFSLEPLRMVEAGEAGIVAIDRAVRAGGFPLGPFQLMDLVGIDVNLATTTAVWERLGRPARLRPSPIQQSLVERGALGRKTGEGFYRYADAREPAPADSFAERAEASSLPAPAIVERIRRAIADEATIAVEEEVASGADIDRAVRLGANHPSGPFEWLAGQAPTEIARRR